MAYREGLVYSRHSMTLDAVWSGWSGRPWAAWWCLGKTWLSGPRSLPGCMGTGPWSWTEGLELGLGRLFPLLG